MNNYIIDNNIIDHFHFNNIKKHNIDYITKCLLKTLQDEKDKSKIRLQVKQWFNDIINNNNLSIPITISTLNPSTHNNDLSIITIKSKIDDYLKLLDRKYYIYLNFMSKKSNKLGKQAAIMKNSIDNNNHKNLHQCIGFIEEAPENLHIHLYMSLPNIMTKSNEYNDFRNNFNKSNYDNGYLSMAKLYGMDITNPVSYDYDNNFTKCKKTQLDIHLTNLWKGLHTYGSVKLSNYYGKFYEPNDRWYDYISKGNDYLNMLMFFRI